MKKINFKLLTKENLKLKTKEVVKTKEFKLIVASFIAGVVLTSCVVTTGVSEKKYNIALETIAKHEKTIEDKESEIKEKEGKIKEVEAKGESSIKELEDKVEKYLSLNDNEKELVDAKIEEVKKATADEIAKAKAEEEARKAEEERLAKEEAERKAEEERIAKEAEEKAKAEAEANKYNTGITWEDIARDDRVGELCTFEGKVIQVMSATGETQYRVAINGNYDTVMLIAIPDSLLTTKVLEDDYIYFRGMSVGNMSYTTVLGAEKEVPAVVVDSYNF